MTKRTKIIYWIVTALLALGMSAQGIAQILQTKGYLDIIVHLCYPPYVLYIIGVWKLLGVVAILIPGFKMLKEWAYAGLFFAMTGAAASHIIAGDTVAQAVPALILIVLTLLSWYLRPSERKLIDIGNQPAFA